MATKATSKANRLLWYRILGTVGMAAFFLFGLTYLISDKMMFAWASWSGSLIMIIFGFLARHRAGRVE